MSKNFVPHVCKHCKSIFIDVDLTNAKTNTPMWKYCERCCKTYGYINPPFPPKRQISKEQRERLLKNLEKRRNIHNPSPKE